ncbi:hypothetical protein AX16_007817 [Volvariella volvacea WC 439]|nr:hypothetical protein AX16_007817 [Volvariella volvacea WC 439]
MVTPSETEAPLPPALVDVCSPINDPPPPYPSRERRIRGTRDPRRQAAAHRLHLTSLTPGERITPAPSIGSHSDYDSLASARALYAPQEDNEIEATETTPFLGHSPTETVRHSGRPRSVSHLSVSSVAPSLGQTLRSLFQTEEDSDFEDDAEDRPLLLPGEHGHYDSHHDGMSRRRYSIWTKKAWALYFRPLTQKAYYDSFFHLTVVNFPYALAAFVYLFIFTLIGTTTLMALPIGAALCFLDLLGARAFARGELALQTRFHYPLAYPPPYPPRPIFTRLREPTIAEIENGASQTILVPETSFYKNAYAMFTDPTSYQALFYFLVIKPGITLTLSLAILIFGVPALLLILPAPAALRAIRKLGRWQAHIAVEGLYYAVR